MTGRTARLPPRFARRLAVLLACFAGGGAVAYAGYALTGSPWWSVALPAAIAIGWLAFGTPEACTHDE